MLVDSAKSGGRRAGTIFASIFFLVVVRLFFFAYLTYFRFVVGRSLRCQVVYSELLSFAYDWNRRLVTESTVRQLTNPSSDYPFLRTVTKEFFRQYFRCTECCGYVAKILCEIGKKRGCRHTRSIVNYARSVFIGCDIVRNSARFLRLSLRTIKNVVPFIASAWAYMGMKWLREKAFNNTHLFHIFA